MNVYLALGTNLGNKEENMYAAVELIKKRVGKVTSLSAFYATEPWGFRSEYSFLNACCCVETTLFPFQLLQVTQEIEKELGRTQKSADGTYSDRLIDVDLLLYEDLKLQTPSLTLPHPLMHLRSFVMDPLAEIAPQLMHPVLHVTMESIACQLHA